VKGGRSLKGDEKFALVRSAGIALAAVGGTSFRGADLTNANFTSAMLKSTNFTNIWQKDDQGKRYKRITVLEKVCWHGAKKLDKARVGDSILAHAHVRDLLITRNGYNKHYIDANLRGANLEGVNLNQANLKWADLSGATLHRAELKDANLREVLAIGTDFTAAHLTGACLEAWNIDHTTKLDGVDCQYVFLLEHPNQFGNRDRRPSALENVKVLAEVAQDPEPPEKKGLGSQAVTFLKGAVSFLPDTAKLAEACTKLLPLITKALGLPF